MVIRDCYSCGTFGAVEPSSIVETVKRNPAIAGAVVGLILFRGILGAAAGAVIANCFFKSPPQIPSP